jgi:hypothetical protein
MNADVPSPDAELTSKNRTPHWGEVERRFISLRCADTPRASQSGLLRKAIAGAGCVESAASD